MFGSKKSKEKKKAKKEEKGELAQGYAVEGDKYYFGQGVKQDYAKAVRPYTLAAEQGHAHAQCNLGAMYGNGQGVAKDEVKAVEWYRKSAEQGNALAQSNLGWMYDNGRGVVKDDVKAVKWTRKSAEQGHAQAQYNLGVRYANGRGVAKDEVKAVEWYRKSAEQGYAAAQSNLGWMYEYGRGVAKDYVKAVEWYRKGAEQGNAAAQFNLGVMYNNSWGVVKDNVKAVEWYHKSAEQGYARAQNNLGWMYENGRGVAKDDVKAVKWYRKAAEQGHVGAAAQVTQMERLIAKAQAVKVEEVYTPSLSLLDFAELGMMDEFIDASMHRSEKEREVKKEERKERVEKEKKNFYMKTQNFGIQLAQSELLLPFAHSLRSCHWYARWALKNYKENRENGSLKDSPQQAFPSSDLDGYESFSKDFDWEKDEKRGYPTQDSKGKKERYWFLVKHKQSGQRIEGFYQEPDYDKGFPDRDNKYWYRVVFTDTENPAIRAWMAEKDLNYLDRIQKEDPALYQREIADLKRQNDPNGILPQHEARQRERGVVIGGEPKKQADSTASKKEHKRTPSEEQLEEMEREMARFQEELQSVSPEYSHSEEKKPRKEKIHKGKSEEEKSTKKGASQHRHPKTEVALPDVPGSIVKTIHAYQAPQGSGQLSFPAGRLLELLSDEGKWLRCRDTSGEVGLVPSICVEKVKASPKVDAKTESLLLPRSKVRALHAYLSPPGSDHLTLSAGSVLDLLSDEGNWWRCRDTSGEVGLVPSNHVVKVKESLKANVEAALPPVPVAGGSSSSPSPGNRLEVARQAAARLQVSSPSRSGSSSSHASHSSQEESTPSRKESALGLLDSRGAGQVDMLLNYADLTFGKVLGAGGFGEVYRGDWLGTDVAIKKLLQRRLTATLEQEFRHEAGVMVQLRHPNVLTLYGIVLVPEACMVLEFMAKGSLYDVLHSQAPLSWQLRYQIGLDTAKGLVYLHGKHLLHRDLKSLNVLLNKDYQAKLADFGLSKIKVSTSQTHNAGIAGTTQWIAPELFSEDKPRYTQACDVYSFAMVLWELMSRQVPFHEIGNKGLIPFRVTQGKREVIPANSPESLKVLLVRCWSQQPQDRPKMKAVVSELKAHPVTDITLIPSPHGQASSSSSSSSSSSMWYDQSTEQSCDVARSKTSGQISGVSLPPLSSKYVSGSYEGQRPQRSLPTAPSGSKGSAPLSPQQVNVSDYLPGSYAQSSSGSSARLFQPAAGQADEMAPPPPFIEESVKTAVAKGAYAAKGPSQLSFAKGDTLQVIEQKPSGWWICQLNSKQGLAPGTWLRLVEPEESHQQQTGSGQSSTMSSGYV